MGILDMIEAIERAPKTTVNDLGYKEPASGKVNPIPPNADVEEAWREKNFPDICSENCLHEQCGYRNNDHFGQPCEMKWKYKTLPPERQTDPLAKVPEVRKAQLKLAELQKRLNKLENVPDLKSPASINPMYGSQLALMNQALRTLGETNPLNPPPLTKRRAYRSSLSEEL